MEYVARRRARRTTWRQAKDAFVAIRRVGVGPGVKIDSQREVRNDDMTVSNQIC